MNSKRNRVPVAALLAACAVLWPAAAVGQSGSSQTTVLIDARGAGAPPEPLPFATGGKSPDGHVLGANSKYLTLDGVPWFPIMGEFHFSRYAERHWEEEILKMKAGGVQIISTYVFWIHHEELQGQFDWSGQRDLRRFVELCAKHGMYVWLRAGPWAHGEVRNGGLPDWLVHNHVIRENNPEYLGFVRIFYEQIGKQVKGLFWIDGGPIVGVQIENEYKARGAGKGTEHMLTLLEIARAAGLTAPFYTATAWDGVEFPSQQLLPVFSGYADAFWSRKLEELPPNANYFFTTIRCDENVGDDLHSKRTDIDKQYASYPYLTAEMGGGMEQSYHRRPLMSPDDTAAMTLVKLGSGVTMYGYYMFHGGTNPQGRETTLQESLATGYPNDLPVKSYDYQAPLGEFGQLNPSYRYAKTFHLFLNDFGAMLAPMVTHFPKSMPADRSDVQTPRLSARIEGDHGFLFINNYQRTYPLPARKNLQVQLKLPSRTIEVPRRPVDIPSGMYAMWPVNLDLDGTILRYATAQLLCKLQHSSTYVFFAWPGVEPEFAFQAKEGESIEVSSGHITRSEGISYVESLAVGENVAIRVRKPGGEDTQIILLSRESARDAWKATFGGRERLILSAANLFFDADTIHVESSEASQMKFSIFPALDHAPKGFSKTSNDGIFQEYVAHIEPVHAAAEVKKLQDGAPPSPVRLSQGVAQAPEEAVFEKAAKWSIRVAPVNSTSVKEVFLQISYVGDVARVYSAGKLLTDDFYDGSSWEIRLGDEALQNADPEFELRILPLRKDAPIYLAPGARPPFSKAGEAVGLKRVQVIPEYEVVADLGH